MKYEKMTGIRLFFGLMSSLVVGSSAAASDAVKTAEIACSSDSVCRILPTLVPLKVLPRPRSSIYADKSTDSTMVVPTVPALAPLFVFDREEVTVGDSDSQQGWYRVGATDGAAVGWMRAADVIEWHNSLILSYTPPGIDEDKRSRVLGFKSFDQLTQIVESEERIDAASALLDSLNGRDPSLPVPQDVITAGVVSAEPEGVFADIKDNFYMWPILSWATPEDDPESDERFVEFIQLVPECRAAVAPTPKGAAGADPALAAGAENDATISSLAGDMSQSGERVIEELQVMFVVDTTGSMTPYIDAVRTGIHDIVLKLKEITAGGSGTVKGVSFGFVGFQDDFSRLEYVAKDYTESGMVSADEFVRLVDANVKAEGWGDHMIPERLFEGFQAGVNGQWSEDSMKFMIVVTDAPGIPESDGTQGGGTVTDDYVTLMRSDKVEFDRLVEVSVADAERNGKLASDANITTLVLHITPQRFPELDSLAARQLLALTQNENTSAGYMNIDGYGGKNDEFDDAIKAMSQMMSVALGEHDVEALNAKAERARAEIVGGDDVSDEVKSVTEMTLKAVKAAAMDFLGDSEVSECDYRGWTTDRDLADDAVRALEVNTLLAHDQLDTLYRTLKDIHTALATGELTGSGFIEALQSVGTVVMANPDAIEKAKTGSLASSGLLPRWLEALPYESAIANLSGDDINALTSVERSQLEINVNQKIQYYEAVIEDNARWFPLSEKDADNILKQVTPLPLEELP